MIRLAATITYGVSVVATIAAFLLIFPAMLFSDAPGSGSFVFVLLVCGLGSVGAAALSGKAIRQDSPYLLASALFALILMGTLFWGALVA